MVDYVKLAATATRLIRANGTTVTLNALSTAAADPTKPWRGPVDQRAPFAGSVQLKAVRMGTSKTQLGSLGTLIKKDDIPDSVTELWLVEPGTVDLSDYDELVVGGVTEQLQLAVKVKPADVVLLWVLGTSK